jgi:hypothetical protein
VQAMLGPGGCCSAPVGADRPGGCLRTRMTRYPASMKFATKRGAIWRRWGQIVGHSLRISQPGQRTDAAGELQAGQKKVWKARASSSRVKRWPRPGRQRTVREVGAFAMMGVASMRRGRITTRAQYPPRSGKHAHFPMQKLHRWEMGMNGLRTWNFRVGPSRTKVSIVVGIYAHRPQALRC